MSIEALLQVLPPPSTPLEAQGDWARVQDMMGTALPLEFREFIGRYGTGTINGFISVLNPFATNKNLNLLEAGLLELEGLRDAKTKFPKRYTFPLYPDRGGYIPWAITGNGDALHWRTEGPAEEWPVAVTAAREAESQEFALTLTAFLAQLLRREIACTIFPRNFPRDAPRFVPEA